MIRITKRVPIFLNLFPKLHSHLSGSNLFHPSSCRYFNCSSRRKYAFPFSTISLPTNGKPRVFITRPDVPKPAIEQIKEICEVDVYHKDTPLLKEELIRKIRGKSGLFCFMTDKIDKDVIEAAESDLKVISTMSAEYDHIDLESCKQRGIVVGFTPGLSSASVAEWAVTMMLCIDRNILQAANAVKRGEWEVGDLKYGQGLNDSVVGIVGMGGVGQMICKRVMPDVKQVLYNDIFYPVIGGEQMGAKYVKLDHLLRESDFVVSAVNLWDHSRNLFNAKTFSLMKPSAVFINAGRAEVVDQSDLYNILKDKAIRGAAIDVTHPAPLPKDHELLTLDNLVITPQLSNALTTVQVKMAALAACNLLLGLMGQQLKSPVPMPK